MKYYLTLFLFLLLAACNKNDCPAVDTNLSKDMPGVYTGQFLLDHAATTQVERVGDSTISLTLSYSKAGGYSDSLRLSAVKMKYKNQFTFDESYNGFRYSGYGNLSNNKLSYSISDTSEYGFGTQNFIGTK